MSLSLIPGTGLMEAYHYTAFYVDARDQNSGSHASATSTGAVSTEPSSQTLLVHEFKDFY